MPKYYEFKEMYLKWREMSDTVFYGEKGEWYENTYLPLWRELHTLKEKEN